MNQHTETIKIEGMSCGHCVRAVQGALDALDGVEVEEVRVGEARVRYDAERTDRAAVARAIEEEGFAVAG
jgi:copper chaperone